MNRRIAIFALLALSCAPSCAAVSGTVTDRTGNGLAGVGVSLVLAGTSTTTDVKGAWSLGTTGIDRRAFATFSTRWMGKAVELNLVESATVSVEAFDLKGALQGRLGSVRLGPGWHRLPFSRKTEMVVWLRVTVNGKSETILAGLGGASAPATPIQLTARALVVVDTIRFTWKSKVVTNVPLSNFDTSGIELRMDTASGGWNDSIAYGSLYDSRDGQVYRTVKIGTQTWMAQNLNFKTDSSYCYNNDADNCTKFGRVYQWAAALGLSDSCNTKVCANQITVTRQGTCPTDWHVSNDKEWQALEAYLGMNAMHVAGRGNRGTTEGDKLKANSVLWYTNTGTNDYGFTILPTGYRYIANDSFYGLDLRADFWSASEDIGLYAFGRGFRYDGATVYRSSFYKSLGYSLRCLQD